MDPMTIITIAEGVIQGVQVAVDAWPTVKAVVMRGGDPTPQEQATLDAAADAAHAALQNTTHA
jgi:pyruvate-formate lyase-activating enzyme